MLRYKADVSLKSKRFQYSIFMLYSQTCYISEGNMLKYFYNSLISAMHEATPITQVLSGGTDSPKTIGDRKTPIERTPFKASYTPTSVIHASVLLTLHQLSAFTQKPSDKILIAE